MFRIIQITAVSSSIQPKHSPKFTLFSTLELCGIDEGSKSSPFAAKGVVESLFNLLIVLIGFHVFAPLGFCLLFCGKNCEALLNAEQRNKQTMKTCEAFMRTKKQ